jgi:hypothetical protein
MLRRIFNYIRNRLPNAPQEGDNLHTSAVPEGRVNHTYTEYYFDEVESVDRWTSHGHDIWLHMSRNQYGSYDVEQRFRGYRATRVKDYASFDEALDLLMTRELYVLKNYGGMRAPTSEGVKDYIAAHEFPRGHIFRYAKENPAALEGYLSRRPAPAPAAAAAAGGGVKP